MKRERERGSFTRPTRKQRRRLDSTAAIANAGQYLGERKDFEVYSCDISPDGSRLVTAAGGKFLPPQLPVARLLRWE